MTWKNTYPALRCFVWVENNFPVESDKAEKKISILNYDFHTNVFKYYVCCTHISRRALNYPLEIAKSLQKNYSLDSLKWPERTGKWICQEKVEFIKSFFNLIFHFWPFVSMSYPVLVTVQKYSNITIIYLFSTAP